MPDGASFCPKCGESTSPNQVNDDLNTIHNNLALFRINSHKVLHNQYFSLIFIFLIKPARRVPLAPPFFLRELQWHQ